MKIAKACDRCIHFKKVKGYTEKGWFVLIEKGSYILSEILNGKPLVGCHAKIKKGAMVVEKGRKWHHPDNLFFYKFHRYLSNKGNCKLYQYNKNRDGEKK